MSNHPSPVVIAPGKPKLLDRMRIALRTRHYSYSTERAYVRWVRRYIYFHKVRHPKDMSSVEVAAFLSHLATHEHVSSASQNQAFSALLFLYRDILGIDLEGLGKVVRARPCIRLPVVLTRGEVEIVLRQLHGVPWLMASLMYGSGLRLNECTQLRVKDLDFERSPCVRAKARKTRKPCWPQRSSSPCRPTSGV